MKSGELSAFITAMLVLIGMLMSVYAAHRRPPNDAANTPSKQDQPERKV